MKKVNTTLKITNLEAIRKVSNGQNNTLKYIVIHETANESETSGALNHAKLQYNGNSRQASWHYTVDHNEIYQSFNDKVQCWHSGSNHNNSSIGIEMCVNGIKSSESNYQKTLLNTVELVIYLQKKYNIPDANVIQHNKCSGKNCPSHLRGGKLKGKVKDWNDFKDLIISGKKKPSTPSKPNKPIISTPESEYYRPSDKVTKVKIISKSANLYSDLEFKNKNGGNYLKGEVFTIVGTVHYAGSVYRLKTKSGYYISANKKIVKKI